ncbi:MAG: glycosyltransferase [Crocinitomicaceae bacterium]|nr:glycosyltransferase [Crocinitomicaceae bacterium]
MERLHLLKKSIFNAAVVCVPSKYLAKKIESTPFYLRRLSVISNTLDTNYFSPKQKNFSAEKLILFSALDVTNSYKGLHDFIAALNLISSKFSMRIIFLGGHKGKVNCPVPSNHVDRTADTQVILDLYRKVDLFVTTSHEESFGQTVSEAIASGTPVVAFDNSGPSEIILHKKNGYIASYMDISDLANGIEYSLFSLKLEEQYFHEYIENNFGYMKIAKAYSDLYNDLLN